MSTHNGFARAGLAILLVVLGACSRDLDPTVYGSVSEVPKPEGLYTLAELEQNWSEQTRQNFWWTHQGSRILPYAWFVAIEQPDNEFLFRDPAHMTALRYIPMPPSPRNPGALPIGFTLDIDKHNGIAWMGVTCAACHTGQINFGDTAVVVEGGPTLANFGRLRRRLLASLEATYSDNAKFERFSDRILGADASQNLRSDLRIALADETETLRRHLTVNRIPEHLGEDFAGYARVDAFGIIQNAASALALNDLDNRNVPSAPVSYPFLWGSHQSDWVQWNASLPNEGLLGPLARNVGEVVGSFGRLEIKKAPWWRRWFLQQKTEYKAAVDIANAGLLESWLRDLRSPQWPEHYLPRLDDDLMVAGRAVYTANCAGCHALVERADQGELYEASRVPVSVVGTDPLTAENAFGHRARTEILEGVRKAIYFGDKFGRDAPAIEFAINGTFGLMLDAPITTLRAARVSRRLQSGSGELSEDAANEALEVEIDAYLDAMASGQVGKEPVYKARPLTGIWATAPYLHNGSVPNLKALLMPPEQRPERFWVGNWQFDSEAVGYVSDAGLMEFRTRNDAGEPISGNSNRGHKFGTGLSETDKLALLEFLKSL